MRERGTRTEVNDDCRFIRKAITVGIELFFF